MFLSPEDDQSILLETLSCNLQFFSELITTQLSVSHGVTTDSLYMFLLLIIRFLACP